METIGKIRRAYFVQKTPIKEICREFHLSRKVVRKVIRSQATEFRFCVAITCPSWTRRMGTDPFRAPPSEAQRRSARRMAATRSNQREVRFSNEEEVEEVA